MMMQYCKVFKKNNKKQGFTLVEIAIVLTIIGVIALSSLSMIKVWVNHSNVKLTEARLDYIHDALLTHIQFKGDLPCPASLVKTLPGDKGFGYEVLSKDSYHCNAKDVGAVEGVFMAMGRDNRRVQIGAVPTRTLDIPDSLMIDGWGNRFYYAVTADLTGDRSFWDYVTQYHGAITLLDTEGNNATSERGNVLYVVFSTGPDSKGAYTLDSARQLNECVPIFLGEERRLTQAERRANEILARDSENCDMDAIFVDAPYPSLADGATYYDDYLDFEVALIGLDSEAGKTTSVINSILRCSEEQLIYHPVLKKCVRAK